VAQVASLTAVSRAATICVSTPGREALALSRGIEA
jgi:hypothetical protein